MLMGMNSLAALLCFADAQSMTMERNENLIRNDLYIAKSYLIDVLPQ
ncbi:TPA: phosphoenolpyruvate hydrolase family protein [Vibrio cholerae]|nr:phosphoenolpyruvate hydrolase family protein [Vibrio cholerae]EGQ9332892.1 phosphoenolpyruvate hydrolase family protein [Vibrio cholerae]EGR0580519.1 phosphoenolpyruvate hydrolase family protein [Vibrio cholerae]EHB5526979.1 phosphoenolpyruvate hydrolase family protein [Vibrio cholerae]HAS3654006.1 phosphoenolpyruvate hydrolase family protein [Vibrio cholerae]